MSERIDGLVEHTTNEMNSRLTMPSFTLDDTPRTTGDNVSRNIDKCDKIIKAIARMKINLPSGWNLILNDYIYETSAWYQYKIFEFMTKFTKGTNNLIGREWFNYDLVSKSFIHLIEDVRDYCIIASKPLSSSNNGIVYNSFGAATVDAGDAIYNDYKTHSKTLTKMLYSIAIELNCPNALIGFLSYLIETEFDGINE